MGVVGLFFCSVCRMLQINRKSDVYLFSINSEHKVCSRDRFVACASSTIEGPTDGLTAEQVAQRELAVALPYMNPAIDMFYDIADINYPNSDGREDNVYVSKSYDATSHFQTAV